MARAAAPRVHPERHGLGPCGKCAAAFCYSQRVHQDNGVLRGWRQAGRAADEGVVSWPRRRPCLLCYFMRIGLRAVELDEGAAELAREYLGLQGVDVEDRRRLDHSTIAPGRYDLIALDVYDETNNVPRPFCDRALADGIAATALADDGFVANFHVGSADEDARADRAARAYQSAFGEPFRGARTLPGQLFVCNRRLAGEHVKPRLRRLGGCSTRAVDWRSCGARALFIGTSALYPAHHCLCDAQSVPGTAAAVAATARRHAWNGCSVSRPAVRASQRRRERLFESRFGLRRRITISRHVWFRRRTAVYMAFPCLSSCHQILAMRALTCLNVSLPARTIRPASHARTRGMRVLILSRGMSSSSSSLLGGTTAKRRRIGRGQYYVVVDLVRGRRP